MTSAKDVILVAVDGSDCSKRALDEAIHMAKALNTSLLLAHVVDWSDYSFINAIEIEDRTKMRNAAEK
ncbi:MAG: universal stress protein, partial [Sphingomonadales bacterium]